MNKTADIETAIELLLHTGGPLKLDELIRWLLREGYDALRDIELTWIAIAMSHLERDGKIRYPGCTHSSHEGYCTVDVTS